MIHTHYDTLNIEPDASESEIRAAYEALAQQYLPEKAGCDKEEALIINIRIRNAYEKLIDPEKRAEYDRWILSEQDKSQQEMSKAKFEPIGPASENDFSSNKEVFKNFTFCPNCKTKVTDTWKHCVKCGALIKKSPEYNDSNQISYSEKASNNSSLVMQDNNEEMDLYRSVQTCYSKFFDFNGRASKKEFWWFTLYYVLNYFVVSLLTEANSKQPSDFIAFVLGLYALSIFLPWVSVYVRRLHDTNRSGWWYWLHFTIVGIIPLFFWCISKGDSSKNNYGDPPK